MAESYFPSAFTDQRLGSGRCGSDAACGSGGAKGILAPEDSTPSTDTSSNRQAHAMLGLKQQHSQHHQGHQQGGTSLMAPICQPVRGGSGSPTSRYTELPAHLNFSAGLSSNPTPKPRSGSRCRPRHSSGGTERSAKTAGWFQAHDSSCGSEDVRAAFMTGNKQVRNPMAIESLPGLQVPTSSTCAWASTPGDIAPRYSVPMKTEFQPQALNLGQCSGRGFSASTSANIEHPLESQNQSLKLWPVCTTHCGPQMGSSGQNMPLSPNIENSPLLFNDGVVMSMEEVAAHIRGDAGVQVEHEGALECTESPRRKMPRKSKGGRQPASDPRLDPKIDPKKARRILANRQSAARSKVKQKHFFEEVKEQFDMLNMQWRSVVIEMKSLATVCKDIQAENNSLLSRMEMMAKQFQYGPIRADEAEMQADNNVADERFVNTVQPIICGPNFWDA